MKSVVRAGVMAVLLALSVSPSSAKGKTPKIPIWDSTSSCRDAYATSPLMLKECIDSEQTYRYLAESYWKDTPVNAIQMCLDRADIEKMGLFPVHYYKRLGECIFTYHQELQESQPKAAATRLGGGAPAASARPWPRSVK